MDFFRNELRRTMIEAKKSLPAAPYIMYAHTLELMGIGLDKLRPSKSPFHGVAPGKLWQSRPN